MIVGNDELLTPRELRRSLTPSLEKITSGEIDKLVLIQGGELKFVILAVDEYERLTALDKREAHP